MAPVEKVSALSDHLGYWLRAVSNQVSYGFARKLASSDTTVAEWVMMRTLYDRDPQSPSQMADELGMTRGAITKLADRLIGQGMIQRTPSETDGRAQTLCLTDRGSSMIPSLAALADANDAEWFDVLDADEREILLQLLQRIIAQAPTFQSPIR